MIKSDALTDGLKKGEEKAYRQLFDRFYERLCMLACQFVEDRFLAESFVGDVITSIWENRETLQIHTSLEAYLAQSVKNRCINYLEHLHVRRQAEQVLAERLKERQQDFLSDDDYPLTKLMAQELEEALTKAVDALPTACREVFRLSRMDEMTYPEISERLGISVNTVKYHIKNALVQLHEQLKGSL
jgi:RNA polymerase sigma-70 factor (ECF subfamily)